MLDRLASLISILPPSKSLSSSKEIKSSVFLGSAEEFSKFIKLFADFSIKFSRVAEFFWNQFFLSSEEPLIYIFFRLSACFKTP